MDDSSPISEKILINQVSYKYDYIHNYSVNNIHKLTIYIQMELCKETLGDYISKTQKRIQLDENGLLNKAKLLECLNIFESITQAIDYIHYKENLIHRDLKPTNIFLTGERNVKIGDFGLATQLKNMKYSQITRKNSICSNHSAGELDNTALSFHTKNVGTLLYASPEQLNDNYYDQKVI